MGPKGKAKEWHSTKCTPLSNIKPDNKKSRNISTLRPCREEGIRMPTLWSAPSPKRLGPRYLSVYTLSTKPISSYRKAATFQRCGLAERKGFECRRFGRHQDRSVFTPMQFSANSLFQAYFSINAINFSRFMFLIFRSNIIASPREFFCKTHFNTQGT